MAITYHVKGLLSHRSVKFGLLVCVALFVFVKITRKENIPDRYINTFDSNLSKKEVKNVNSYGTLDQNRNGMHNDEITGNENDVVNLARKISLYNKTVLVSVVNDAYLSFAYSWLCNTKHMNVHRSVLVITTDIDSKIKLNKDWPEVSVFHIKLDIPKGDQDYSHVGYVKIMIRRTEIILSLLKARIDLLLLEFDYVWFTNPIYGFQRQSGVDMLVNPVSKTEGKVFNGGLLYMFATERTLALWTKLTAMMKVLEESLRNKANMAAISESDNDQTYLSKLIRERYANITYNLLTLDKYSDGKYYSLSEDERRKLRPLVISNNWIIGNKNKISRAKIWNHWFLKSDGTCDVDTVNKIVYK